MTCNEIENRLPAYQEGLLPPEERGWITGHLAACSRCTLALANLKKAERLVHGLKEVEPPPFFDQRIMSRIREEAAQKRGFLRRLFYPLQIKVPLQALATLLVAVLVIYLYQTGDPEMKQIAPPPMRPATLGKDQGAAELAKTPPFPSAVTPARPAPSGDLPEKDRQQLVAPPFEKRGKEERRADLRAPIRESRPSAMKSADPVIMAREGEAPPISAEGLSKGQDRAGEQDAGRAVGTLPPEQKRKEKRSDAAVASGTTMPAPLPSRLTAAAAVKRSSVDLTIQVGETDLAIREIEARLRQVNGRIVERERRNGNAFLKAEIAAQNVGEFLNRLDAIGRVNLETGLPAVPEGSVTVSMKIVTHP